MASTPFRRGARFGLYWPPTPTPSPRGQSRYRLLPRARSGGAFSSAYTPYGSSYGAAQPSYPAAGDQAPLYATFQTSAPRVEAERPLMCGCGMQWTFFAVGFLLPPIGGCSRGESRGRVERHFKGWLCWVGLRCGTP